jgi:hypothetical protein
VLPQFPIARPKAIAILAGVAVLIPCVLMRLASRPYLDQMPALAAALTFLVFVIPGMIAGLVAPRAFFWNGAILGLVSTPVVTLIAYLFSPLKLPPTIFFDLVSLFACVSISTCILGALAGCIARRHR